MYDLKILLLTLHCLRFVKIFDFRVVSEDLPFDFLDLISSFQSLVGVQKVDRRTGRSDLKRLNKN